MRRLRIWMPLSIVLPCVVVAVAAGPAGAVSWSPQSAPIAFSGVKTIRTNGGASVMCTLSGWVVASGGVATTTDSGGTAAPPTWSRCSNSLSPGLTTCVTSSSPWRFNAISTSSADESNVNFVARIGCSSTICSISASGVTIRGGVWSNSFRTLTENASATFAITESGLCDGGTTATLSGTLTFASPFAIVP